MSNQPPLAETDTKTGARVYKHPLTGKRLPSVTTIMGNKAKPALIWWAAGLAAQWAIDNPHQFPETVDGWAEEHREQVYQTMRRAHQGVKTQKADIGSEVHLLFEALAKGLPLPEIGYDARPYIRPIMAWVEEQKPDYLGSEVTVWNEEHEYAGTLDSYMALGDADETGKRAIWLLDTKTGNNVWPETVIQLAALGHASNERLHPNGYTEPTLPVDHYGILHVIPDIYDEGGNVIEEGAVVLHSVDQWIEAGFAAFVGCRALHRFGLLETQIKKALQG